jgi:5S rRNA maturation endonuclease (ribonuclease M5)
LKKLGYTTTTPGGVKDWKKEYASYVIGAKVVILPDNDEPGLELKDRIMRDLKHYAHSIRWTITSRIEKAP